MSLIIISATARGTRSLCEPKRVTATTEMATTTTMIMMTSSVVKPSSRMSSNRVLLLVFDEVFIRQTLLPISIQLQYN